MREFGRSHDGYRGQVARATSVAADFARTYGFQLTSRYSVDLYGEDGALVLASSWAEKAQHFFDIWSQQSDPAYKFTEAELASWQPRAPFRVLLDTLTGRACRRVRDLLDQRQAFR